MDASIFTHSRKVNSVDLPNFSTSAPEKLTSKVATPKKPQQQPKKPQQQPKNPQYQPKQQKQQTKQQPQLQVQKQSQPPPQEQTKHVEEFKLPGGVIKNVKRVRNSAVIGPGLRRDPNEKVNLRVTRCGNLLHKSPNVYWMDTYVKRYLPKRGDFVVGTVIRKAGNIYKVDIGGPEQASMSAFAFEGATKKLRPKVEVGDVLYARVLTARREMEPDIVCVNNYFKAANMGLLGSSGFVLSVSLDFARSLLKAPKSFLRTIGRKYVYEAAIGVNGRVWINARTTADIIIITQLLKTAMKHSNRAINHVCRKYQ